jgi:uncharacterized metal-binding protein
VKNDKNFFRGFLAIFPNRPAFWAVTFGLILIAWFRLEWWKVVLVADRAARNLTKEGTGKMYCLAGVGGKVSDIMAVTESASVILVVDGCSNDCAKKTLEQAGFRGVQHLRITDTGMEKGLSPPTRERVEQIVLRGKALLSR